MLGSQASDAWSCLNDLQSSAPYGSKVVRLVGNHELWWLQGYYHMRHPEADTREVVESVVLDLKERILNGEMNAAFVHQVGAIPILFVHAGLRPSMMQHLQVIKMSTVSISLVL